MGEIPVTSSSKKSEDRFIKNEETRSVGKTTPPKKPRGKRGKFIIVIVVIIVIAALVCAGLFFTGRSSSSAQIDSSKFQAVFLDSGQVYFGRLQIVNEDLYKLTDVWYLQTKPSSKKDVQSASDINNNDVQLVQLGNEIHGPTDEMLINRDKVDFFENLKNDGTVVKTITNFKAQQKK